MYLRVGLDSFDSVDVIANKTHVVCLEPEPSAPWQRDVLLPNLYVPLSNRYLPEFLLFLGMY